MKRLLPLAVILLACNDPVSPPRDTGRTAKPRSLPQAPSKFVTDEEIPAVYTPQSSPETWCNNAANAQPVVEASRAQRLKWDDASNRAYDWVVWGRKRIHFRGYVGTYQGQPIQCIRLVAVYFDGQIQQPINSVHPKADFYWHDQYGYNANFAFCWGSSCSTNPARIHVQASKVWFRQINIDENQAYQTIRLGTIVTCCGGNYNAGEWDTELHPNGYWTVFNYGGNGGSDFGWWGGGATGYFLFGSYKFSSTPGYYDYRDGQTHWTIE
jgi:hypothetical protein